MAFKVMHRVIATKSITDPDKFMILLALAFFSDEYGRSWPAVATVAEAARMSIRKAQRTFRQLEHDEMLKITVRGGRNTNTYQIQMNRLDDVDNPVDNLWKTTRGKKQGVHTACTAGVAQRAPLGCTGILWRDRGTEMEPSLKREANPLLRMRDKIAEAKSTAAFEDFRKSLDEQIVSGKRLCIKDQISLRVLHEDLGGPQEAIEAYKQDPEQMRRTFVEKYMAREIAEFEKKTA